MDKKMSSSTLTNTWNNACDAVEHPFTPAPLIVETELQAGGVNWPPRWG